MSSAHLVKLNWHLSTTTKIIIIIIKFSLPFSFSFLIKLLINNKVRD